MPTIDFYRYKTWYESFCYLIFIKYVIWASYEFISISLLGRIRIAASLANRYFAQIPIKIVEHFHRLHNVHSECILVYC